MRLKRILNFILTFSILTLYFLSPVSAEPHNGMEAEQVLGQINFSTAVSGVGSNQFSNQASGVATDGKRLFITDFGNHRILIYNTSEAVKSASPDMVVGSSNFTSAQSGTSSQRYFFPREVFSDGKRMFLCDTSQHRVLIWDHIPTSNLAAADVVIGQQVFTANGSGTSSAAMNTPRGVFSYGEKLFVVDAVNHRILIWNNIPTANGTAADLVVGQPDFSTVTSGVSSQKLNLPLGVAFDGKKLYVVDAANHRVLIWNSLPNKNFAPADVVVGQPDFTSNNSGTDATHLNVPAGIATDGKKMIVSDFSNNRVLIWNSIPEQNNVPADIVLGQNDFVSGSSGLTNKNFNGPIPLAFDGHRLYVGDAGNIRVMIFNLVESSAMKLGPQFEQGKGVLGKVFWDHNGNGIQNDQESGMEGVKVVSDTGIYAITDEDGKYHFPFIETGQRVLKIDKDTLPEDCEITTDNPYKAVVTEGVLTKVSFGVRQEDETPVSEPLREQSNIMLKVSVSQESSQLKPRLGVRVEMGKGKQEGKFVFTIDCNYFLFIKRSELKIYDQEQKLIKTIELPQPVPLYFELPSEEIVPLLRPSEEDEYRFYYQVSVYDQKSREDRTSIGTHSFTRYQVP